MKRFQFYRIVAFCFVFLFFHLTFSAGQGFSADPEAESDIDAIAIDPLRISVNVREVRLDVVVVDGSGRPITDLTADDFEVYQDKLPQEVTSSFYINNQTQTAVSPVVPRKAAPNLSPLSIPAAALKEEDVRRTILFVVDNLSMEFDHLYYAKMGIKRFVDRQMQSGDMVAIMRTGYGNSALNMFSSNKSQINVRADAIPMQKLPDTCYGDFATILYDNQISALSYSIRALKDMPGRKIIFFMSSCPNIYSPLDNFTTTYEQDGQIRSEITPERERARSPYERYANPFDRLANEALQANVVVHTMDTHGLENRMISAEYDYNAAMKALKQPDPGLFGALNPLSTKTGGINITNSNFFLNGIGEDANNMIAGYYLVSYVPPPDTFDYRNRNVYNRVSIKVKRKGAVVYTRDGFYSRTENETAHSSPSPKNLVNAILSPFQYSDLNVNMAAGYIKNPKSGSTGLAQYFEGGRTIIAKPTASSSQDYIIRAWIHLDAKDLKIVETEDGGARIDLEVLSLTSNINGDIKDVDENNLSYTFTLEARKKLENIAWLQRHGIRFSMLLPVKKPGAHTVHIAVRDANSDKIGSAYQFLEIPDLKNKGMELSSVFMITSEEDLVWMRSDVIEELAQRKFFTTFQESNVRTPALRSYAPGDKLHTLVMLYNADAKAISRSEIEVQSILYKDGEELLRGKPRPIAPNEAKTRNDDISILQNLTIGPDMPPGDYLLQLLATDKKYSVKRDDEGGVFSDGLFSRIMRTYLGEDKNYNRKGVASQILSFTVTEQ